MDCSTPGFPVPHHLPEFAQVDESVVPSNHLILCHPLLLLTSAFPSIRVFSSESAVCIRKPKYWSFSFSISPSNEYSGLISFKTDWFDLPTVRGMLKSLLQHHSLKASILWCSGFFFIAQLSHPYMTSGKTIAWSIWTFIGKVMSLLFSTLSRFVITFLPRGNRFPISWLQSPSAVILEPRKRKSITAPRFSPSVRHEVMGLDAMILVSLIFSFKLAFSPSFVTLIKRLFSSFLLSTIRVVSSTYLKLILSSNLDSSFNPSSPEFHMMCSVYKLNKQGDNKQPCHTPFSILNQSVVPYRVITVAS